MTTFTTVEQLNALPVNTLITALNGSSRIYTAYRSYEGDWLFVGTDERFPVGSLLAIAREWVEVRQQGDWHTDTLSALEKVTAERNALKTTLQKVRAIAAARPPAWDATLDEIVALIDAPMRKRPVSTHANNSGETP